ncbi:Pentatricopeptide repeat protein [Corchorus olitorius]|uniref:Pentatricopeptide repeat protein n=1 Tax=Corchorus olitorius TaxID=93759 RepID=A0A1R3G3R4_9ROSI|nr:Pentatricopeptide repeat protein [Corchorus olitorius]
MTYAGVPPDHFAFPAVLKADLISTMREIGEEEEEQWR